MSALMEVKCCKCGTPLMRSKQSDSYICDDCFDILQSDGGEEALAVKLERAAVVKYLREWKREHYVNGADVRVVAKFFADAIEKGEHHGP